MRMPSGGVTLKDTIVARPPNEGATILTWPIHVPADATALSIQFGLADAPPPLPLDLNRFEQLGKEITELNETLEYRYPGESNVD